jgi:hypothetical protein
MKYDPITRRHFLEGLGGSLLALPLLPSLIPATAKADVTANLEKCLVMISSGHGGFGHGDDYLPRPFVQNPNAGIFQAQQIFAATADAPAHIIHSARLSDLVTSGGSSTRPSDADSGQQRLSHIYGAFFNPFLSKMNLFVGLDGAMAYYGHSSGIHGGHIWHRSRDPETIWPTIDRFLSKSNRIYPNRCDIATPVLTLSGNSKTETGGTAPSTKRRIDHLYSALFEKYDPNKTSTVQQQWARREFLIDRVMSEYQNLTRGAYGAGRQLSSLDRQRVDQHVEKLFEVQCKYKEIVNSCSATTGPRDALSFSGGELRRQGATEADYNHNLDLALDLVVAAFACGSTRIANLSFSKTWTFSGDYHHDIAHGGDQRRMEHNDFFRWESEYFVSRLVDKMNSQTTASGANLLDQSLVAWVHECGPETHSQYSVGVSTFGSLGGYFKTGNMLDYRSRNNTTILANYQKGSSTRPGIPMNRFWANILQGMGIPRNEFERYGRAGYGDTSKNSQPRAYHQALLESLSDPLPVVT